MKNTAFFLLLFLPALGFAQPKMHIKAWVGGNSHRYTYRAEEISTDFILGWQGGFGFRVRKDYLFGELDFGFIRYEAVIPTEIPFENDAGQLDTVRSISAKFNAFDLPIMAGVVPIRTPLFKWYLQTGLVNRFNVREILTIEELDIRERLKPRDVGLPVYDLHWRIGSQVDIAMINIGFNYTLNITNAVRETIRTNVHIIQLDVGILF